MKRRDDLAAVLVLALVWALVVGFVGLGGDFALNDDWAYAYTARHLLRTGQLRILDWAAPTLATHAVWGAAALSLLGDSYVSLRCGTLIWALGALVALYALARSALPPRAAVLLPLAVGLSPWFVNLSFTYMTEVPWMALLIGALLAFTRAWTPGSSAPPRAALLLLSGALVGAAATTRQYAIVTTPAFALVLMLEARRREPARWVASTVRGGLLFGSPVAAIFVPFYLWYTRVHGPTQANRETVARTLHVQAWQPLVHILCFMHYAGLWLFPLALALLVRRRLWDVVTRRQALSALVLLVSYAVMRTWLGHLLDTRVGVDFDHPAEEYHAWMPYLGNVFYLVGLGPLTITDLYRDKAATALHSARWFGMLLTVSSTLGGIAGCGLLATTVRHIRETVAAFAHPTTATQGELTGAYPRREMLRVLLFAFGGTYLLFLVATSQFIYDRYLLPLLPVVFSLGSTRRRPLSCGPRSSSPVWPSPVSSRWRRPENT